MAESAGETRDGTGAGDHNQEYQWGSPLARLTLWQQAWLIVLRGKIRDRSLTEDLPEMWGPEEQC